MLYQPSESTLQHAKSTQFIQTVNRESGQNLSNFHELQAWSVDNLSEFWSLAWDSLDVIGEKGQHIFDDDASKPFYRRRFFVDGTLNFAENLLRRQDDSIAIDFWGETQVKRTLTWRELYDHVSQCRQYLQSQGVGKGDRVAALLPNVPEAVIAMLATASLGAMWTSTSPDFGVQGVLDRFGQVEPTVLFVIDQYFYKRTAHDCREKNAAIAAALPSLNATVEVSYLPEKAASEQVDFETALSAFDAQQIEFERFEFNLPAFILYSSGTTGVPKCIVHGAGGTLLQHMKEHQLHADMKPDDRFFYFTTCGWMMWNWLVSGLASETTVCLYDGSPFVNKGKILFDFAEQASFQHMGVSAKYIDAVAKLRLKTSETHDLSNLKSIFSTGSPLSDNGFDYVYQNIKPDVCLSSISGGTDIVSCFVLGANTLPVYRGELQTRGLGMAVNAFDDAAKPIVGEKGELVCTQPFPCMPLCFWRDDNDEKYRDAYFSPFDNIWCHGDYVELTEHNGMVFHGRSDAVLNPGGVRIGTAEIYRQVETIDEVLDSVVVGQDVGDDVRVVLFVRLREGVVLDDALTKQIKNVIRANTTARHVPEVVVAVTDIPKTKSGKTVELAVRNVIHNRPVKNVEALANPASLAQFKARGELRLDNAKK